MAEQVGATRRVLVLGAGLAGLSAARALRSLGYEVVVLEARDRVGGRCWTVDSVEYGAAWIHSTEGNPISSLARELEQPTVFVGGDSTYLGGWEHMALLETGGQAMDPDLKLRSILASDTVRDALDALRRRAVTDDLPDRSMRAAVAEVADQVPLTDAERRAVEWHMAMLVRDDCAADDDDLSFMWWDEGYEVYGYGDSLLLNGYSALVDTLADGLDVRLGHVVREIHYGPGVDVSTEAHGDLAADIAIVTLPLGVLKSGAVCFDPPLPGAKTRAIQRLGFGVLNKVIAHFKTPFWPLDQYAFGYAGRAVDAAPTCIANLWRIHHIPALAWCVGGTLARQLETWPEQQLHDWTTRLVRDVFGVDAPAPERVARTSWYGDPFARGSYSYIAVGSTPADLDALAEPVDGCLFFAGEATARQHWATTHSAYISGLREAARISGHADLMPPRHFTENRRWRAMLQRANRFFNVRGRSLQRDQLEQRLAVLRVNQIFGAVPPADLEVLASMFDTRSFETGECMCVAGDRATEMFVIMGGEARVELAGRADRARLQRGDVCGEYGMFGQGTRSATIRVSRPTVALVLDYQRFQRFLMAFPESMRVLLDETVQRLLDREAQTIM